MLQERAPVVTILGHVDHGKTTLLDKIRNTNVAAKEAGQITQAIGAYQVEWKGKLITFLDTPGHEAFIKMRSRGVQVADIAVLVVAADDGVMPQTKESIKIIKEAKIPFLVAINKIDLPNASVPKVKAQLAENEVFVEGFGGDIVAIPISAKTGEGIEQLLEMILLLAEINELKGDPQQDFEGVVIESKKDRLCGPVATIIVKNGTLQKGEILECEGIIGKVRSIKNDKGEFVHKGEISQPVQILGFDEILPVGAKILKAQKEYLPKKPSDLIQKEAVKKNIQEGKKIRIILKADTVGSLEAIKEMLPEEVELVSSGVGDISESDIFIAKTALAFIYGFNINVPASVAKLADTEKVKIKTYNIIYELEKDIQETVLKFLEPTIDKEVLGKAEIIAEFNIKGERIAGGRVVQGQINKADKIILERKGEIIGETRIKSLRHGKEEIEKAEFQTEFGVTFSPPVDFQIKDVIISYK